MKPVDLKTLPNLIRDYGSDQVQASPAPELEAPKARRILDDKLADGDLCGPGGEYDRAALELHIQVLLAKLDLDTSQLLKTSGDGIEKLADQAELRIEKLMDRIREGARDNRSGEQILVDLAKCGYCNDAILAAMQAVVLGRFEAGSPASYDAAVELRSQLGLEKMQPELIAEARRHGAKKALLDLSLVVSEKDIAFLRQEAEAGLISGEELSGAVKRQYLHAIGRGAYGRSEAEAWSQLLDPATISAEELEAAKAQGILRTLDLGEAWLDDHHTAQTLQDGVGLLRECMAAGVLTKAEFEAKLLDSYAGHALQDHTMALNVIANELGGAIPKAVTHKVNLAKARSMLDSIARGSLDPKMFEDFSKLREKGLGSEADVDAAIISAVTQLRHDSALARLNDGAYARSWIDYFTQCYPYLVAQVPNRRPTTVDNVPLAVTFDVLCLTGIGIPGTEQEVAALAKLVEQALPIHGNRGQLAEAFKTVASRLEAAGGASDNVPPELRGIPPHLVRLYLARIKDELENALAAAK